MSKIDITAPASSGGSASIPDGVLQTAAQLSATLQIVTDNLGNASTISLSTTEAQVNSTLRIKTNNAEILDIEDSTASNRFNINRSTQKINLDFASKPTDITTVIGAIRTSTDGTNLADVMTFRENGNVAVLTNLGVGIATPTVKLEVAGPIKATLANTTTANVVYYDSATNLMTYGATPGGTTPTLAQVTTAGNTTTNAITLGALTAPAALLDLVSTTQGFLPPRMTDTQRAAIATPPEGLIVYNTTNHAVAYRDGTNWGYLSGASQTIAGSGGTVNIPFSSGNIVELTLTASTTLTLSGHVVGTYIIKVIQGGSGSYTLTYPASVKWSGGTAPTLSTTVGKIDIITLFHDGTDFFGTYSLNY